MPHYKKDISYLNHNLDAALGYVSELMRRIDNTYSMNKLQHKAFLAMLYLTGSRPAELILMQKNNIQITDENVFFTIKTLKRGYDRTIILSRNTPFMDLILEYFDSSAGNLFSMDLSTYKKMIYKVSDNNLMPYSFRHFRLTYIAVKLGANPYELKYWKGAKDTRSVDAYVHLSGSHLKKFADKIR